MGTSGSNKGARGSGTPSIPTWVENVGTSGTGATIPSQPTAAAPLGINLPKIIPSTNPDRYRAPRSAFSAFAKSGGRNHGSLSRAVGSYIKKTVGGSRKAARGMGSSRIAGARLLGFLSDVSDRGVPAALKTLNLENLASRPIEEVFLGLVDYICPEGGTVDAAIAREAFTLMITDLAESGITDLGSLNKDQMQTVFELFATHAIEMRLYNEIANKAIALPVDAASAASIQEQLRDFVRNGVADALTQMRDDFNSVTPDRALKFVDQVYEQAFTILAALSSKE